MAGRHAPYTPGFTQRERRLAVLCIVIYLVCVAHLVWF